MTQDGFTILSPSGHHMNVGVVTPTVNGLGTYSAVVTEPLPGGALVQSAGKGNLALEAGVLTGSSGALQVDYVAGEDGSERAVCALTDGTGYITVHVDILNRPFAIITDSAGTVVAESAPLGLDVIEGHRVKFMVTWDSANFIEGVGSFHAAAEHDNELFTGASWTTDPNAPWASFTPTTLTMGYRPGETEFNGTLLKVQAGTVPGI